MFATDFIFNSQRASDLDLMICTFNGEIEPASGGEIEYEVVKTPDRDNFTYYGAKMESVLVWNISICKNPCKTETMFFTQTEERTIQKWFTKLDGYKLLQFLQDGYEDVYYRVLIDCIPHQISGRTIGFDLKITSDCAYGYSDEIIQECQINSSTPYVFMVNNDINRYIYPHITINGSGTFFISNESDPRQNLSTKKYSNFKNVENEIIMKSDCDIIMGINSPDDFSWYFIRLLDGINTIVTDSESDISMEIKYREIRRVIV